MLETGIIFKSNTRTKRNTDSFCPVVHAIAYAAMEPKTMEIKVAIIADKTLFEMYLNTSIRSNKDAKFSMDSLEGRNLTGVEKTSWLGLNEETTRYKYGNSQIRSRAIARANTKFFNSFSFTTIYLPFFEGFHILCRKLKVIITKKVINIIAMAEAYPGC